MVPKDRHSLDQQLNAVLVIDTAAYWLSTTIPVGNQPVAFGVFMQPAPVWRCLKTVKAKVSPRWRQSFEAQCRARCFRVLQRAETAGCHSGDLYGVAVCGSYDAGARHCVAHLFGYCKIFER